MISFRSKWAYEMMYYMLTRDEFAMRIMSKDLGIHYGKTVYNFVQGLIDAGYVKQSGSSHRGGRRYEVVSPVGLIGLFSTFRKMKKIDTFRLGTSRDEMMNYLNDRGVIFCLSTALSFYSKFFLDPAIYAYLPKEKAAILKEDLSRQVEGKVVVNLYDYEPSDKPNVIEGKQVTSKVRTVIDLFCDNKGYAAEQLISELW